MKRYLWTIVAVGMVPSSVRAEEPIKFGSKKFTESVILAEMGVYLVRDAGGKATHESKHKQLGGTQVLWKALLRGDIDIYPDYTGTLLKDILKNPPDIDAALAAEGVRISRPFGYNNSYGLGMKAETARRLGIRTISDLRNHSDLRYGFSEEFRNRDDGWNALRRRYGLQVPDSQVRVLDHDLAYRSLDDDQIDVLDIYTTEGQIRKYAVVVLKDDARYFPLYEAVWVYRADLPDRLRERLKARIGPQFFWLSALGNGASGSAWPTVTTANLSPEEVVPVELAALLRLEGAITESEITEMNYEALRPRASEGRIAADFLRRKFGILAEVEEESVLRYLLRLTGEHLLLVSVSLAAAIVLAVPLGVWAAKQPRVGSIILAVVAMLQTLPSLAVLVLLIPWLGLGPKAAIAALFLYSLLPIVRNTYAGLKDIPGSLRESAAALGLPPGAVLRLVELPLAMRSILAGIKTAAVINVGTATLGAFIGAGGFGEPIQTGLRVDQISLILLGAIPAAVLALLVQGAFELVERRLRKY